MGRGDGEDAALHGDGWTEIEDAMAAAELPQMPPTSDPERLLRYVLQIHPKYSEMEMMATHLRLYATSLEQDLEQARNHSRILSSEVAAEREKKQFLERYAAQIVKERNELLHARTSKKSKTAGTSHFTWHSCCKKSGEQAADLMPSMAAFRSEKLQEAMSLVRSLQDEARNQERLRQEVNFMLKRTHREHDSKTAADRKHIQQLEKQLVQRAMLQSTMERKLYEVESALARHDTVKLHEMSALKRQLEEMSARVGALENQCERYRLRQGEMEIERDDLQDRLTNVMLLKDELTDQVENLSSELTRAQTDVDSLRGEVEVLQSEDVTSLKSLYEVKMEKLQNEWSSREHDLKSQVDALRHELRVNETLLHRAKVHADVEEPSPNYSVHISEERSQNSWTRQRDEWLRGSVNQTTEGVEHHIGSSLSRSQLSHSLYSDESDEDLLLVSRGATRRSHEGRKKVSSDQDQSFGGNDRMSSDRGSIVGHEPVLPGLRSEYDLQPNDESFSQSLLSSKQRGSDEQEHATLDLDEPEVGECESNAEEDDEKESTSDISDFAGGGLLADMHEMLKQFQDRRIQEEEKAVAAEKALETYRQDRDEFRNMLAPIA